MYDPEKQGSARLVMPERWRSAFDQYVEFDEGSRTFTLPGWVPIGVHPLALPPFTDPYFYEGTVIPDGFLNPDNENSLLVFLYYALTPVVNYPTGGYSLTRENIGQAEIPKDRRKVIWADLNRDLSNRNENHYIADGVELGEALDVALTAYKHFLYNYPSMLEYQSGYFRLIRHIYRQAPHRLGKRLGVNSLPCPTYPVFLQMLETDVYTEPPQYGDLMQYRRGFHGKLEAASGERFTVQLPEPEGR